MKKSGLNNLFVDRYGLYLLGETLKNVLLLARTYVHEPTDRNLDYLSDYLSMNVFDFYEHTDEDLELIVNESNNGI